MDPAPTSELRLEPRTNLFVVATLYAAEGSTAVRIRNMSPEGALIEGVALPPVGSAVQLCRGSLSAAGCVVWIEDRKAGVRFSGRIAVAEWLPSGKAGTGQMLADELVHQARLGAMAKPQPAPAPANTISSAGEDELLRLCRSLEEAGEELAADAAIAERFPGPLQAIDMAAQALAKLAARTSVEIEPPLTGSAAL